MLRHCLVWIVLSAGLALPGVSLGASGQLTACDPSTVQAGDITLLTLQGDLPTGILTVEFFPQRVTVLNTQQIDAHTLSVQVSVPLDAPGGAYNILVYNQQGAEALGSQLFTVAHRLRAPRITGSEPETIEAGLTEVKLTLHCDVADTAIVDHLRVEWTHGSKPAQGLTSEFSRDGLTAIGLKLGGSIPLGELLGKLYFDTTPVYLIKLTRVDKEWSFIGHRPSRAGADELSLDVTLIGQGLTRQELAGCSASMLLGGTSVATVPVQWSDNATARARFSPVPHPGEYVLAVSQGGTVFYQGPLTITGLETPTPTGSAVSAPAEDTAVGTPPAEEPAKPALPQWQDAAATPPKPDPAAPVASPTPTPSAAPAAAPADTAPAAAVPPATVAQGTSPTATISLKPDKIDVKKGVYRLELRGLQLGQDGPDAYAASLSGSKSEATLMFMGLGADSLVLLFKAPDGGWVAGEDYTLTLVEKATQLPLLARLITAE